MVEAAMPLTHALAPVAAPTSREEDDLAAFLYISGTTMDGRRSRSDVPAGQVGENRRPGRQRHVGLLEPSRGNAEAIPDSWVRIGDLVCKDEDGYFSSSTARRT
ncbi:hypothetical protein JCM4814A_03340 [Streptomyces phaeofaciens JCM 4814]|uniref:Uncharacterized protein n=1 Tax=Streptomyces phaeofaciens TaxID=68254 RepID=A0A918HQR7_9ACTN|nr:hypothetical protein GCM10010226_88960 [Streptomyces phaeofaciens]